METNTSDQPMNLAVPNSTAVLVLGILSIVTCWCNGIIGLILGIIALVLASNGTKAYEANPSYYSENSFKNLNAGKICAIIGTSLSGLFLLFVIYMIVIGAAAGSSYYSFPWHGWK